MQASCPDIYRGKFNRFNSSIGDTKDQYVSEVESILKKVKDDGRGVAAYIAESLVSCGGQGKLGNISSEILKINN